MVNARQRLGATLSLALVLLAMRMFGKEPPTFVAKLSPALPCPAIVAAAQSNQISLGPIEKSADAHPLNPGDSVTALFTLCQKSAPRSQWLLHLEAVPAGPGDASAKAQTPMVLYTSLGNKLEFSSTQAFVNLRMFGPFAEDGTSKKLPAIRDKSDRFTVEESYLGLGLDRAAAAIFRARQIRNSDIGVSFGDKPFSDAKVAKSREMARAVQLTPEEERAIGGSIPALLSYMGIIGETPGLEEILLKVVDRPSLWSMLWHRGVNVGIRLQEESVALAEVAGWGLPADLPVYSFPLELDINNHRALDITLLVTSPRPPLLECGGIIGFVAEKPGDNQTYLTLRIVSAHCAKGGEAVQY